MEKKSPRQLYWKLFCIYSILIISIVSALAVFFTSVISMRIRMTNGEYVRMEGERAQQYMKDCARYTDFMILGLYQSEEELKDLLYYLSSDTSQYLTYRLETYSKSEQLIYRGFDRFVQKSMEGSQNLDEIRVISYGSQEMTVYKTGSMVRREKLDAGNLAAAAAVDMVSAGAIEGNSLVFMREIRNPVTLASLGCMLAVFNKEPLAQSHEFFPDGQLVVYSGDGELLFTSVPEEEARMLIAVKEAGTWAYRGREPYYVQEVRDYTVMVWMSRREAGKVPYSTVLTIFGSAAGVIGAGILLIHIYLKRLTWRLNRILSGMEEVTRGNLKIHIETEDKKDELDLIADHFNRMCRDLETYIQKSYQAEIDQKNAEMAALQSQINPHFLYNTLESIRMMAICNGDREVGKLLYGLAVLFRSQVKEADVINLAQELRYCKKYLELFEFRYQQKFKASVECPEELLQKPVIKFVLQPVIENYFEHGIRMEKDDNILTVTVKREDGAMRIYVEDNGYGMEEEELQKKNRELSGNDSNDKSSIGLANVNRRLKAAYGREYGVGLRKGRDGGLCVILYFPEEGGYRNV